jgi:hypothetical protein
MAFTKDQEQRVQLLDSKIRPSEGELAALFMTEDGRDFRSWYSRLLSTLVLAVGEEDIEHGIAQEDEFDGVEVVVFTSRVVIVSEIPDLTVPDGAASTGIVPRSAIRKLDVSAAMPVDVNGPPKIEWPGRIEVEVEYNGLNGPITFAGETYDRYAPDHISDTWKLYEMLRGDLSG